ncbi:MAG: hypothetical protein P4L31_04580 [Candidatus Babeliales bacterium]|nr:hypothetical protein [Candidatus Babeliales bacterium]
MKLYQFLGIALSICLFNHFSHAAKPAEASSVSSPNSAELPPLTALQEEKLNEFKKKYEGFKPPTAQSILELIEQYKIHPTHLRYGHANRNCALGWAIQFSNDLPLSQILLKHGDNPNARHDGHFLLIHAENVQAAQLLLDFQADVMHCDKDLLPTTICHLRQRDPQLIQFYINKGIDPDLTGYIANNHPMISLSQEFYFTEREKLAARYLIEGGTSLSYKNAHSGYTAPQILKKKLQDCLEDIERYKVTNDRGMKDFCDGEYAETLSLIAHVKKCADDRRAHIHTLIADHLPVSNGDHTYPLANMVMNYYEPMYEAMENEPLPNQAATQPASKE